VTPSRIDAYNRGIDGHDVISADVLATYAGDAARGVSGVRGLCETPLHRKPVRVSEVEGGVSVELHLAFDWGTHVPTVGEEVQRSVAEYLARMAKVAPVSIDVIVDEIGPPAAAV
jgi:uncharacterized alkaline shock family protein YloU